MRGNSFSVDGCYRGCELRQEFSKDFDREVARNTAGFLALLQAIMHCMVSNVRVGARIIGKFNLNTFRKGASIEGGIFLAYSAEEFTDFIRRL